MVWYGMKGDFMGLFGFLKRSRSDQSADTSDKPEARTGAFKGDLAFIRDTDITANTERSKAEDTIPRYTGENKDSADSDVYMSFAPRRRNIWTCSECGTINEESLDGCIVCGLKK